MVGHSQVLEARSRHRLLHGLSETEGRAGRSNGDERKALFLTSGGEGRQHPSRELPCLQDEPGRARALQGPGGAGQPLAVAGEARPREDQQLAAVQVRNVRQVRAGLHPRHGTFE